MPDTETDEAHWEKLLSASLLSTICGWITGSLFFMIYAGLAWGSLTHIDVFILGTIPFTVLGWMFFFVPLILIVDGSSGLFRLPMFTFVGVLGGIIAFLINPCWLVDSIAA